MMIYGNFMTILEVSNYRVFAASHVLQCLTARLHVPMFNPLPKNWGFWSPDEVSYLDSPR